jgi:hypothetical protein
MLCARMTTLLYNFWIIALCYFNTFCLELISKALEVSTWNFTSGSMSLRRRAAHKNNYLPCIIFQLLPFVIFSHHWSHRIQICYHFCHLFSLPQDLFKLNYSEQLHIHCSNEQTCLAGMAMLTWLLSFTIYLSRSFITTFCGIYVDWYTSSIIHMNFKYCETKEIHHISLNYS